MISWYEGMAIAQGIMKPKGQSNPLQTVFEGLLIRDELSLIVYQLSCSAPDPPP
jgi:hypothetical protein